MQRCAFKSRHCPRHWQRDRMKTAIERHDDRIHSIGIFSAELLAHGLLPIVQNGHDRTPFLHSGFWIWDFGFGKRRERNCFSKSKIPNPNS
jgi:hypothetical protein